MSILFHSVFAYVAFGIPIAIMFSRAGLSWALSLYVLIPFVGIPITLLILMNRKWQPRKAT